MPRKVTPKLSRKTIDEVLTAFGVISTLALLVVGSLAWWGSSFAISSVRTELSNQQIYFPAKGSPALASSDIGPYLNKYAGDQLLTGPQAKAYADHFIAVHLSKVAGGQTYAQVSTKLQADPTNATLKAQQQTLFQGETLRGLLLNAYAFWTVGYIGEIVSVVCLAAGVVMAVLTLLGFWHLAKH